jgi:hypothetical protein
MKKITLILLVLTVVIFGGVQSVRADGCCCKDKDGNFYWSEDGTCE